jgi:hypothetical protein
LLTGNVQVLSLTPIFSCGLGASTSGAFAGRSRRDARAQIERIMTSICFEFEVLVRLSLLSSLVLWFVAAATLPSMSQTNTFPFPTPPLQHQAGPEDEARRRIERDMAKKANHARQADLRRDTEKLLKLSMELKEYVDKTNENMLSVEVVKKAEEIEKLAHSVKEKMKGSY